MRLTPPKTAVFLITLIVAVLTIVCHFVSVPVVGSFIRANEFWFLAGSYVLLALSAIFKGL